MDGAFQRSQLIGFSPLLLSDYLSHGQWWGQCKTEASWRSPTLFHSSFKKRAFGEVRLTSNRSHPQSAHHGWCFASCIIASTSS